MITLLKLNKRDKKTHKGDYGRALIIGGSKGMVGSVYLSAIAALRTGSGLVFNIVPEEIREILEIKSVENIILSSKSIDGEMDVSSINQILKEQRKMDAIALGPGMGKLKKPKKWMEEFLFNIDKPLVIDADGLNNLAYNIEILKSLKYDLVLTPHVLEFSRLTNYKVEYILKNREKLAKEFAEKYNVTLVLKGNKTIVTNGRNLYINETGNPGMATAGSGDVLTGIITSLIGQGYSSFLSAKYGVYIHGLAGDLAAEELSESGIIARDIIEKIPYAMKT